jgi:hypothetical protein
MTLKRQRSSVKSEIGLAEAGGEDMNFPSPEAFATWLVGRKVKILERGGLGGGQDEVNGIVRAKENPVCHASSLCHNSLCSRQCDRFSARSQTIRGRHCY